MKTFLFLSLQFFLISTVSSQWELYTYLPYTTEHPPLPLRVSVVDSSVTWVLCAIYVNPHPFYPCFINRTASGWKMITNTDLDSAVQGRSIYARDSNTAWLGTGWPENIYFTSDGGTNWILQSHISDTGYVEEVMFSKKYPHIGYAFGGLDYGGNWHGVRILKTTNSGLNWTKWDFNYEGYLCAVNSMAVVDSSYAWFGMMNFSGQSKIIMTSNGGINWNIINVNGGFAGPCDVQFSSNCQTGLYVCSDNITRIYRSTDSGIGWYSAYTMVGYFYFNTMRWVTGTSNIYAQTSDFVLRSVNNGLNWSNMTGISSVLLCTMDAVKINSNSIYALAIANDREVYKLIDTVRLIGIKNLGTTVPEAFKLFQNYPNPFNPATTIKFDLPRDGNITIEIYDVLGRSVASLAKDEFRKAGSYEVSWDASNYPSGVYFYRLVVSGYTDTKKMVLMK